MVSLRGSILKKTPIPPVFRYVYPGSQPPFMKWWFLLYDDKPYYKEWWFANQPIKNGGWTSRVSILVIHNNH